MKSFSCIVAVFFVLLLGSVVSADSGGHWGEFSCKGAWKYAADYGHHGTVFGVKVGYYPSITAEKEPGSIAKPRTVAQANMLRKLMAAARLVNPSAKRLIHQNYAGECWQDAEPKPQEPTTWKTITKEPW